MTLPITAMYAVALTVLLLILTYQVILRRAKTDISINHGDDEDLAVKIRRHGNFIEFVPMGLILMGLAEMTGPSAVWIHAVGLLLLASRIIQPMGMHATIAAKPGRIIGGSGTQLSMALACGLILWAQFA